MKKFFKTRVCRIVASCTLASCTTADPTAYSDLASAQHLKADSSDRGGRTPYRYNSEANWEQYDRVIVDPVTVYRGQGHQFGEVKRAG